MSGKIYTSNGKRFQETTLPNGVKIITIDTGVKRHFEIVKSLNHYGNDAK